MAELLLAAAEEEGVAEEGTPNWRLLKGTAEPLGAAEGVTEEAGTLEGAPQAGGSN